MMLIPDCHLQFTFGYQIRFRSISTGIGNVQKYRVELGFLKRAWAGLWVENHDPVPVLVDIVCVEKVNSLRCFLIDITTSNKRIIMENAHVIF